MQNQTESHQLPSTEPGIWTWIILAGLLVLGVLIGGVSLGIMSWNEQLKGPAPAAAQPAPVTK